VCRGFNDAVNGFGDDGWVAMVSDGLDDVSVMLNATPKSMEGQIATDKLLFSLGGGILCAKASMLLQVYLLIRHCFPCTFLCWV
jgi:homeobox-leucine zipper protein